MVRSPPLLSPCPPGCCTEWVASNTTGAPELERALRIQGNTLEQFAIFVPSLWLAALYFQGWIPGALGLVWCVGRIIYAQLYLGGKNRFIGFALTMWPTLILVLLAIIGIVQAWMVA